jgi:membrane-bound metal-dependent hydrolase YbcI (DUF457 family)
MSPITHFLTGWMVANLAKLDRKDRAIVTLACVVPDIDGLGIIPELLTRNSSHPLLWFTLYHHSLHTLAFALVVAVVSFALARHRSKAAWLALLSFIFICWKTWRDRAGQMATNGRFPIWRHFHRHCSWRGGGSGG